MIQITATEVTLETSEKDPETGKPITVTGQGQDRYWLTAQPTIAVTAYPNALNKLCRKLVELGLSGPAEVRGMDGRLRFTINSVEKLARVDLRERDGSLVVENHRPFPGIARAA